MNLAIIVAHPDDEFFASGAICELKKLYENIHLIFTTTGEGARYTDHFRNDGETRKHVREREGRHSAEILGVNITEFFGFADPEPHNGKLECGFTVEELTDRLKHYFETYDINTCITHGTDGEYGHPAHLTVHNAVLEAAHTSANVNFVFTFCAYDIQTHTLFQVNLTDPANYRFVTSPHNEVRRQVLKAHRSQLHCFAPYYMIDTDAKKNDIDTLTTNIANLRSYETMYLAYKNTDAECFKAWQIKAPHYASNKLLCTIARVTSLPQKLLAKII